MSENVQLVQLYVNPNNFYIIFGFCFILFLFGVWINHSINKEDKQKKISKEERKKKQLKIFCHRKKRRKRV